MLEYQGHIVWLLWQSAHAVDTKFLGLRAIPGRFLNHRRVVVIPTVGYELNDDKHDKDSYDSVK